FHLQHRRHSPFGFLAVLVVQHLDQDSGNDLPRHTESVLEPAALDFLTACGELSPEVVDFFLRVAVHDEGYRLGKLKHWSTVQRREFLTIELKCHGHNGSMWDS